MSARVRLAAAVAALAVGGAAVLVAILLLHTTLG
jgi:hypothetical protein